MLTLILLTSGATQTLLAQPAPWQPTLDMAAASPAEIGQAIFSEADQRDSGYGDLQVSLRMVLRTARGRETERELRIKQLEVPGDGDMVLAVFDAPANIRGTALLSHGHPQREDDQWLFLSAMKRTKKIASRNKTGSFVGSEFSFEDLAPLEIAKYTYAYVAQEACATQQCYVVDRFPVDQYSGYLKHRVWLDTEALRIYRIDYTNKREQLEKRLELDGYQLYADQFYKPDYMRMQNLLNGRSTDLHWFDYQFNNQFTAERDFSVNSLRRAR